MKKLIIGLLMVISGVVAASTSATNYLFVQAAPSATLTHVQGNRYILVLKNNDKDVWYFSDRPVRKTGAITLDEFSKLWTSSKVTDNFISTPPNAAIALTNGKKDKAALVAVLGKPIITADKITYNLSKISENSVKTGEYSQALIFIDNVQWNPGGF